MYLNFTFLLKLIVPIGSTTETVRPTPGCSNYVI